MNKERITKQVVKEGTKLGASDVACIYTNSRSKMVRFSNNEITVSNLEESNVINTFLSINGKISIGALENLNTEAIRNYVKNLVEIAKLMKLNCDYTPLPAGPFKYPKIKPFFDSKINQADKELVDYVKAAINAAKDEGAKRSAGALIARTYETSLHTSENIEGSEEDSSIELSIRAFASDDASGNGIACSRTIERFDAEEAGRRAGRVAVMSMKPVEANAGHYRVLLGPYIFANLLNDVISSASAFNVDAGLSFFPIEMMNRKVAAENLTIYDDGTIPDGLNSRTFDDEGAPTQNTKVIEKGYLKSLLHNSMTAKKYKTKTTGNAGWIAPSPWNIIVEPGDISEDKMLDKLDNGLYITNTWYTRFQDYMKGDFSTVCRDGAFIVKNGQIVSAVKDIRISDNMINILKNIEGLSRERQWVKWWEVSIPTLAPSALIKDVGVTRTTK